MKHFFRVFILPNFIWMILKLLRMSWKITLIEPPEMTSLLINKKPFLLAHWHGDEIVLIYLINRYKLATITSNSADGELMTRIITKFGGVSSRGSSSKGGATALRGIVRLLKSGKYNSSIAVDGPKGPRYKVKPGIFEISRLANLPIFWVGVTADKYYTFHKAWNKAILPKPFSRVFIQWHGPMEPINKDQDPRSKLISEDLEDKLNLAKKQATHHFLN